MGYALAMECARRGAQVELVSGPVSVSMRANHPNIHRIDVESAQEMYEACIQLYPAMDSAILCAAVADFTPCDVASQKIKRTGDEMILRLKPNPDIAASLGKVKKANQILVGFALETNDEETNAQSKLKKKNFDFIVLNSLRDAGAGFQTETNKITIITADDKKEFPLKSKAEVAVDIINQMEAVMR
jgi:phosphopantothenoylcysteine decarboxylase/phosphopantothenate--cysteine ligase